jgi:hypothetical protein
MKIKQKSAQNIIKLGNKIKHLVIILNKIRKKFIVLEIPVQMDFVSSKYYLFKITCLNLFMMGLLEDKKYLFSHLLSIIVCLYYESYYEKIGKFLKSGNKNEDSELGNIFSYSETNKVKNKRIKERYQRERDPEYLYRKIKEDMLKLKRLYKDVKYRKEMEEPYFQGYSLSIPKYELTDLY